MLFPNPYYLRKEREPPTAESLLRKEKIRFLTALREREAFVKHFLDGAMAAFWEEKSESAFFPLSGLSL